MIGDISFGWVGQSVDYRQRIELLYVRRELGETCAYAKPVTFELAKLDPGHLADGPTLSLTREEARQIMQVLWDSGIRPNDGAGSIAETQSLRAHIKFSESVVDRAFKLLEDGKGA